MQSKICTLFLCLETKTSIHNEVLNDYMFPNENIPFTNMETVLSADFDLAQSTDQCIL